MRLTFVPCLNSFRTNNFHVFIVLKTTLWTTIYTEYHLITSNERNNLTNKNNENEPKTNERQ